MKNSLFLIPYSLFLPFMDTSFKSFIEELQALEEPTKTKVLVVSTTVLMIIVLYFWWAYFNGIVSGSDNGTTISDQGQPVPVVETSPQPGFWSRVGNGTAIVGQAVGGGFQKIGQAFESPKEYIIK